METKVFKLTPWKALLVVILLSGLYAAVIRYTRGLGAATHLSDAFPWGLWVGFDVLCGVMLAAGGFLLTATVHLFNLKKFKPIIRPTLLTAFLGYLLVVVALLFDLGRPYRIWHPLVMWNPHSVMFEVAWCVMLYTTVLALEFAPIAFQGLKSGRWTTIRHAVAIPLVIAGVILSTLHQSSLGSLYLIVPDKLHPLWYSSFLPVFFFVSAVAVGLAMTIFESWMSSKAFHKQLELPLLQSLGRVLLVVLGVYAVMRFEDLLNRGALPMLLHPNYEVGLFSLEVAIGLLLPILLLLNPRVRETAGGLYLCSVLVLLGFVTNRLNVSITGMEGAAHVHYIPKWTEFAVTASIIAAGFTIFAAAVKYLPIFPQAAGQEAVRTSPPLPEMTHAPL
ncbi:MAG TPA: Ni/Fe-hydrogenase cytochrome b subunit [Terriglobia bacterium]|nr:Ni/Fe-hydrogenase cytochrome b subunit [Terriglobia bacterium]